MSGARPGVQIPTGVRYFRARRFGVDTQYAAVVFMRKDCPICRSEGLIAHNRLLLRAGERHIIATKHQITNDLAVMEVSSIGIGLESAQLERRRYYRDQSSRPAEFSQSRRASNIWERVERKRTNRHHHRRR